jgi:hypothetical protein
MTLFFCANREVYHSLQVDTLTFMKLCFDRFVDSSKLICDGESVEALVGMSCLFNLETPCFKTIIIVIRSIGIKH